MGAIGSERSDDDTMWLTYWMVFTNSLEVYGPAGAVMPLVVIFIAAFLLWYTNSAKVKGWIS